MTLGHAFARGMGLGKVARVLSPDAWSSGSSARGGRGSCVAFNRGRNPLEQPGEIMCRLIWPGCRGRAAHHGAGAPIHAGQGAGPRPSPS